MASGNPLPRLQVPQQQKPDSGSFNYKSKALKQWSENLPVGNVGETARMVYSALREVNRLQVSWSDRLSFLEQIREPVRYVQEALGKKLLGASFPLPEKSQRIATLSTELYLEMSLGYKAAILGMLDKSFLRIDSRSMAKLIHRAIRYHSLALLNVYQVYAAPPPHVWQELHELYRLAESKNIHADPVEDDAHALLESSSVARLYKQILMLALSAPYRLRQGEAHAVYAALEMWALRAEIKSFNDPDAGHLLFAVHMDSDDEPEYQAMNRKGCNTELCRLVDTRELTQTLLEELKQASPDKSVLKRDGQLPSHLIQRLISSWGMTPQRAFSRTSRESELQIIIGITALHDALVPADNGNSTVSTHKSHYNSKVIHTYEEPTSEDIWNEFSTSFKSQGERYIDSQNPAESPDASKAKTPSYKSYTCQVINDSAGGYRLGLRNTAGAQIQVGDILGVKESSQSKQWQVGVIRWIRQEYTDGVELGVQVLAPTAQSLELELNNRKKRSGEPQRALLLPDLPILKQPKTLVTPVMLFKPGDELLAHIGSELIPCKLHSLLQHTGSFSQYLFEILEKKMPKEKPKDKPVENQGLSLEDTDENDFGNIWSDI